MTDTLTKTRTCTKCGEEKPEEFPHFQWHNASNTPGRKRAGRWDSSCRACIHERQRAYRARPEISKREADRARSKRETTAAAKKAAKEALLDSAPLSFELDELLAAVQPKPWQPRHHRAPLPTEAELVSWAQGGCKL